VAALAVVAAVALAGCVGDDGGTEADPEATASNETGEPAAPTEPAGAFSRTEPAIPRLGLTTVQGVPEDGAIADVLGPERQPDTALNVHVLEAEFVFRTLAGPP